MALQNFDRRTSAGQGPTRTQRRLRTEPFSSTPRPQAQGRNQARPFITLTTRIINDLATVPCHGLSHASRFTSNVDGDRWRPGLCDFRPVSFVSTVAGRHRRQASLATVVIPSAKFSLEGAWI